MTLDYIYISHISLFLIVVIWLPLVWWFSKFISKSEDKTTPKLHKLLRWSIFTFLMLIPTWDVIVGTINLNLLCAYKGGGYVNEKVYVDGYIVSSTNLKDSETYINKRGFKYIESVDKGKYYRYSKINDEIVKEPVGKLKSSYQRYSEMNVRVSDYKNPFGLIISRHHFYIKHLKTEKIIGGYNLYNFSLGWVDRYLLGGFMGVSVNCNDTLFGTKERPIFKYNLDSLYPKKE